MLDSFRLNGNSLGYYSDVNLVLKITITRCARFGSLVAGLTGLSSLPAFCCWPFLVLSLSEAPLRSGSDTELTELPRSKSSFGGAEKKT